jgi:flagellar hook assembly protein FlgD
MTITSNRSARLSEVLSLNRYDLPAVAIDDNQELMSIDLNFNVAAQVVSSNVLSAYPNPFTSFLNLDIPVRVAGPASLSIYDINGRLVMTESRPDLNQGMMTWNLNTANLPVGQYVYRLATVAGQETGKVVKQ